MSARSEDTSLAAYRVQTQVWERMGPTRRLELAIAMSEDLIAITCAGIAARHPEYDAERVRLAEIRLRLGDRLFVHAYPDAPMLDA